MAIKVTILGPFRTPLRVMRNIGRKFFRKMGQASRNFSYFLGIFFNPLPGDLPEFFKRLRTEPLRDLKFANRMRTAIPLNTAILWNLFAPIPILVVYRNSEKHQLENIMLKTREYQKRHRWVRAVALDPFGEIFWSNTSTLEDFKIGSLSSWRSIRNFTLQFFPAHDLLLINMKHSVPEADDVTLLKYATNRFYKSRLMNKGVTCTGIKYQDQYFSGFDYSPQQSEWAPSDNRAPDFGQQQIPRRNLATLDVVNYISNDCISSTFDTQISEPDFESQLNEFIIGLNQSGRSLLCMPQIRIEMTDFKPPRFLESHKRWLQNRQVSDEKGKTRIIFVLPATSISGGIRVVMQIAQGLSDQGKLVEIWSLEGNPDWFDLSLNVKKFNNYQDLGTALSQEDAIKVATWWETGNVVWEASINRGIPVNFVQEFETWFFPENPRIQAAVVASYRQEFRYISTGGYQSEELKQQGIDSIVIPVGFDSTIFRERQLVRSTNTVLALGRSFFQKNFKMTLSAWRSLPHAIRPKLQLFGIEPNIATDAGISYVTRPTDEIVAELYSTATCFIQTSYHEGFSLPLIEAMASGCPVITTNSHGNMDFCVPNENCLLVEQDNTEQLAEQIMLITNDVSLQEKLRKNGLKTAQKFTWKNLLLQYGDFFDNLNEVQVAKGPR